jgi:hypothetical protein
MSDQFDSALIEWGERLFQRPLRQNRPKKSVSGIFNQVKQRQYSIGARANRVRQKIAATTKRVPEVMVKISGSGRGMNKIKAHLEYISRNGKVELENEVGETITGRDSVSDLENEWAFGQYGISSESQKREAFNIVLSMPPGTDREAVTRAARDFAKAEFSENHQYVFATHDDEKHPHVHLCVKALGIDGTRLNPRKQDLQHWRELFAEKMQEHGIEANATPRRARGIVRQNEKQSVVQMRRRDAKEMGSVKSRDIAPTPEQIARAKRATIDAYHGLAQALTSSSDPSDRKLVIGIVDFLKDMPLLSKSQGRTAEVDRSNDRSQAKTSKPTTIEPAKGPER